MFKINQDIKDKIPLFIERIYPFIILLIYQSLLIFGIKCIINKVNYNAVSIIIILPTCLLCGPQENIKIENQIYNLRNRFIDNISWLFSKTTIREIKFMFDTNESYNVYKLFILYLPTFIVIIWLIWLCSFIGLNIETIFFILLGYLSINWHTKCFVKLFILKIMNKFINYLLLFIII